MKTSNPKLLKAIHNAVECLNSSERGHQVLIDLRALLSKNGYGLDSQNMTSLCILVEAVRTGFAGTVSEELQRIGKPDPDFE